MIHKLDLAKSRFGVIGLGETGLSIIHYLKYHNSKIVRIFDTRDNPPHQDQLTQFDLCFGSLDYKKMQDIDVLVLSPGVSIYDEALQLALKNGILVVGDIELFALAIKSWNSKVIGITGSNGKTTVTSLTGYLANGLGYKTLVAGNIGDPVLDSYLEVTKTGITPEVVVLELSSFQLESTYSLDLASATVLNISEDHLDRYRDYLEYAYVKANIFNNCKIQVLNELDPFVKAMARPNLEQYYFSINGTSQYTIVKKNSITYLEINGKQVLDCSKLGLVGTHNFQNCLASIALLDGARINYSEDKLIDLLTKFQGLEHRMQKVLVKDGITYIEDSKGTNVGAVVAGVSGLDMPVNLILGGDGKGQDFSPLRQLVLDKCKSVAIIGQDKLLIDKVLQGINIPIKNFNTLEEAIVFLFENAVSGDCIVLSPACASWDMFDNYKHRARVFVETIYEITK